MRRQSIARRRLAAEQAALLAALVGDGDLPPGFDPAEAAAAASVLSRRAHPRSVHRFWGTARQLCSRSSLLGP